jgi:hypothetical protein
MTRRVIFHQKKGALATPRAAELSSAVFQVAMMRSR